jgi:hypothetical protein
LALPPQHGEELRMRIFNADGSEGRNVWQWHSLLSPFSCR